MSEAVKQQAKRGEGRRGWTLSFSRIRSLVEQLYRRVFMVTTTTRTDEDIQLDVLEELKWDARVQPNEVGVSVKGGIVTLSGFVNSYTKKYAAEEAAHRVRGVKAVANDIEVRLLSSSERTDPEIAADATRALESDASVPADKIKVTVSKGWITLEGEVEWRYQKDDAERAVRRLTGVKGVSNLIQVRPRIKPSPDDLKRKIEDALVRSAETDAERITVDVQGNKVILRGTVRAYAEMKEAERVAWSAPGVAEVDNQIKVSLP
jgi:osmotically-inducible protein OsmY